MKAGQYIELSDAISLQKSKDFCGLYEPLQFTIERVGIIHRDLGELTLGFTTTDQLIITLEVDGKKQYLILQRDVDVLPKNRKEYVDNEEFWLFQEPKGEWNYLDLQFTVELSDDKGLVYNQEFEFGGNYSETPSRLSTDMYGAIVQYVTNDAKNFLVLTEIGDMLSENGGLISMYRGYSVLENDIRII